MSRYIPVEPEKWAEMVKAMKENARLKAEVEVQNQRIDRRDEDVGRLSCENATLKAEVERLEGLVKYWQIEAETDHALWVRHAETNERLRKAGDAMAKAIKWLPPSISNFHHIAWMRAKEGKPSA